MGGIQGINGLPPTPERPSDTRERNNRNDATETSSRDGVNISPEAREASEVVRATRLAGDEPEIRQERVEQARAALENGDFQLENRVQQVAARLLRFLE